jgi:hypothetical protein
MSVKPYTRVRPLTAEGTAREWNNRGFSLARRRLGAPPLQGDPKTMFRVSDRPSEAAALDQQFLNVRVDVEILHVQGRVVSVVDELSEPHIDEVRESKVAKPN